MKTDYSIVIMTIFAVSGDAISAVSIHRNTTDKYQRRLVVNPEITEWPPPDCPAVRNEAKTFEQCDTLMGHRHGHASPTLRSLRLLHPAELAAVARIAVSDWGVAGAGLSLRRKPRGFTRSSLQPRPPSPTLQSFVTAPRRTWWPLLCGDFVEKYHIRVRANCGASLMSLRRVALCWPTLGDIPRW